MGGLSLSHKRKGIMIFTLLVASTVVLLENKRGRWALFFIKSF